MTKLQWQSVCSTSKKQSATLAILGSVCLSEKNFRCVLDLGEPDHFDLRLKFYYQLSIESITSSVTNDIVS
jgi:hypothetical protein